VAATEGASGNPGIPAGGARSLADVLPGDETFV
jgi:hypothetical protein